VQTNFTDECAAPIILDELTCTQLVIAGMTADGTVLVVPTTLNDLANDRMAVICDAVALMHFDGATGNDLGYDQVNILDQDGNIGAFCFVYD
jgi:hypothetical protein